MKRCGACEAEWLQGLARRHGTENIRDRFYFTQVICLELEVKTGLAADNAAHRQASLCGAQKAIFNGETLAFGEVCRVDRAFDRNGVCTGSLALEINGSRRGWMFRSVPAVCDVAIDGGIS